MYSNIDNWDNWGQVNCTSNVFQGLAVYNTLEIQSVIEGVKY